MSTEEAKAKSEKFTDLAKRNTLHHHVGMTGYAAKRPKWRREEREAAEAGLDNLFEGVDEQARYTTRYVLINDTTLSSLKIPKSS